MSIGSTFGAYIAAITRAADWPLLIAALAVGGRALVAQEIRVVAPADAESAPILRAVLAPPRQVLVGDSARTTTLARGATYDRSVVIIGSAARVASTVRGDVVVVGGDLFVHPGASIEGRAVAIGGAVYGSTLARIGQGSIDFRDETYDLRQDGSTQTLVHRRIAVAGDGAIELPLLSGVRIPSYDRVNGLSFVWGPLFHVRRKIEIEPLITARTNLGEVDPSLMVMVPVGPGRRVRVSLGRETATNERWIRSDLMNSLNTVISGDDVRNYYRRDAASAVYERDRVIRTLELTMSAGIATERAWSVGPFADARSSPWSVTNRHDVDRILRTNPPIDRGRISSVVGRGRARWRIQDVRLTLDLAAELPWETPRSMEFAQGILDFRVEFPTFRDHRISIRTHAMATVSDSTPGQRWSYFGGSGTVRTVEPTLRYGGDAVFFTDSRYTIPFARIKLPLAGSPALTLRHVIGSAGVGGLPSFVQNIGARLTLGFFRTEYSVDPVANISEWSFGLSFSG
jgi:hypothetical protein